jgi:hypothetical protein
MSDRPTDRYTPADHQCRETAREAHYDLLRETGYSAERSREVAERATDAQMRALDKAANKIAGGGTAPTGTARGRPARDVDLITPWPWSTKTTEGGA